MQASIILAHPDPQSFNHAIARTAVDQLQANGHQVVFHDLYAEGFDPILPAAEIPAGAPLPPEIEQRQGWLRRVRKVVCQHFFAV